MKSLVLILPKNSTPAFTRAALVVGLACAPLLSLPVYHWQQQRTLSPHYNEVNTAYCATGHQLTSSDFYLEKELSRQPYLCQNAIKRRFNFILGGGIYRVKFAKCS